jgi:prepilin-type N-terminal cleavage/methylation domain-containing protein
MTRTIRPRPLGRRSRQSGVTLIEMMIAILVLTIGLVTLAQLFVWATMNNTFVVRAAGGTNDAQRLVEYWKYVAHTSGIGAAAITSSTWDSGTQTSAAFVGIPNYVSAASDYQENVWVYTSTGALVGTASPSNPPDVDTSTLRAPTLNSRLIYIRMTPRASDPRTNKTINLVAVIGGN